MDLVWCERPDSDRQAIFNRTEFGAIVDQMAVREKGIHYPRREPVIFMKVGRLGKN